MTETLWDFAVARYQHRDVAECCLRLQDNAGADINLLLTAAWLAAQGRRWQGDEVRELIALCASWREHCILPLRAVRRHLKDQSEQKGRNKIHSLYTSTKALELEAEMYQLHLLHAALQTTTLETEGATDVDALAENLCIYFSCIISEQQSFDTDCSALIAALRE